MTQNFDISKRIEVQKIRQQIDQLDDEMLSLILKRRDLAMELARLKTEVNDLMDHEQRVKEILSRIEHKANEMGMEGAEVRVLWKALIAYMIKEQTAKYTFF